MAELPTEYRIYCYAIKGYAQSDIAIFVKVSPACVCKVIKKLIDNGYLKEVYNKIIVNGVNINKKTKPILYESTDIIYPYNGKLTSFTSGMQKQHNKENEKPRLNLKCVQYKIIKPAVKEISGHKWTNNNATYLDHKEIFECGQVTFRIINDCKLVLWLPEKSIDKFHIRGCTNKIYSEAQIYADWFQRKFGCRLGFPEKYQESHIAFQENDPLLCELVLKHGLIKIVDGEGKVLAWWDQSKGHPEFETRDEQLAEARAFAPEKILWLEDNLNSIKNKIETQESGVVDKIMIEIEEKIGSILEDKVGTIIEKQLSRFFEKTRKPDNYMDVV